MIYGSLDPAPYVPVILAPWVKGLFGIHMLHTLCCGMNIGIYGQDWGVLVPRNEGVPLADYDYMAVWTLHPMYQQYGLPGSKSYLVHTCYIPSVVEWILAYMTLFGVPLVPRNEGVPLADCDFIAFRTLQPMYQQYRLPGSKGYLVHACYIPSVVEWILAFMAKFGVPWFPETKASLWQNLTWWQSGPCTLCTSNIVTLGQRATWYTHVTYPLLWNEFWRIWPILGCLGSQKRRRPYGRLWFMAVWTLHPMYQQYRLPGSKGYLVYTCCIPSVVEWILAYMAKIGLVLVARNEGVPLADYDYMAVWTLHPMYQQYRLPGSKSY